MRDDLGGLLFTHPFIRIDEGVPVILAEGINTVRDGRAYRPTHADGPIQSEKLSPEMRS
ncbi:Uncharacterised protein [Mycobacteroides abscessus subsp. abscessus]|nr:Uncharacterised protein [Mycobacteroides abscessus subsp. abscessus]